MPERFNARSEKAKPQGSMISHMTPKQADVRKTAPTFPAISG
jgi:hypothetical protein